MGAPGSNVVKGAVMRSIHVFVLRFPCDRDQKWILIRLHDSLAFPTILALHK